MMTDERLDELEAIAEAATPGPWVWQGNTPSNDIHLNSRFDGDRSRGIPYHPYVMRLRRWGMQGAQPVFPGDGYMRPATDFASWDHNEQLVKIDHPNAAHIAAANPQTMLELIAEIRRLRFANAERQDWAPDDVWEAVNRVRAAADSTDDAVSVAPRDLRMLFASADGVADSYSIVLEHICGLTKPTTDPDIAIRLADDRETERVRSAVREALEELANA